jgi:hypothetical protein
VLAAPANAAAKTPLVATPASLDIGDVDSGDDVVLHFSLRNDGRKSAKVACRGGGFAFEPPSATVEPGQTLQIAAKPTSAAPAGDKDVPLRAVFNCQGVRVEASGTILARSGPLFEERKQNREAAAASARRIVKACEASRDANNRAMDVYIKHQFESAKRYSDQSQLEHNLANGLGSSACEANPAFRRVMHAVPGFDKSLPCNKVNYCYQGMFNALSALGSPAPAGPDKPAPSAAAVPSDAASSGPVAELAAPAKTKVKIARVDGSDADIRCDPKGCFVKLVPGRHVIGLRCRQEASCRSEFQEVELVLKAEPGIRYEVYSTDDPRELPGLAKLGGWTLRPNIFRPDNDKVVSELPEK